jgi:hypothetical protein
MIVRRVRQIIWPDHVIVHLPKACHLIAAYDEGVSQKKTVAVTMKGTTPLDRVPLHIERRNTQPYMPAHRHTFTETRTSTPICTRTSTRMHTLTHPLTHSLIHSFTQSSTQSHSFTAHTHTCIHTTPTPPTNKIVHTVSKAATRLMLRS